MNTPAPRSWKAVQSDPRVAEAWYEGEDGYWVSLKPGLADHHFDQNCHTIHEWTVARVLSRLKGVSACTCKECTEALAEPSPAPVVSPVTQTREQAEAANAREWAQSLPAAQLERLLGDVRDHLQSLGAASLEAVKAEWNARKDASQTPAEPACPVFPCVREAGHEGEHVSPNGEAWKSPAEPAPSVESVQTPYFETDGPGEEVRSAAPSPADPVKVPLSCGWLAGVTGSENLSASVVPVEVPAVPLRMTPRIVSTAAIVDIRDASGELIAREVYEPHADFILTACNSHAAHLAKIQALKADIQFVLDTFEQCGGKDHPWIPGVDAPRVIARLRAALALPTAPRSDS